MFPGLFNQFGWNGRCSCFVVVVWFGDLFGGRQDRFGGFCRVNDKFFAVSRHAFKAHSRFKHVGREWADFEAVDF